MSLINKLFYTKDKDTKYIFIKLWTKCPTACPWCSYWTSKDNLFYDIELIKKNIISSNNIFLSDFKYFLYGVNLLEYNNLNLLLELINKLWREAVIQIDINNIPTDILFIDKIFNKYKNKITFLISSNIFTISELNKKLETILYFKNKEYIINFDIVLKISRYHDKIKKFLLIFSKKWIDKIHKNIFFIDWNISWTFTNSLKIDDKNELIHWLNYKKCIMQDFFTIKDWNIFLSSHLEVTKEWYLKFHTPVCFLSDIKISNINFTNDRILNDFNIFTLEFVYKKWFNMNKECYKCIKWEWYTYKN